MVRICSHGPNSRHLAPGCSGRPYHNIPGGPGVLAIPATCRPFSWQQSCDPFPARRDQRRQSSNGQQSGEVERRIGHGDRGPLACLITVQWRASTNDV